MKSDKIDEARQPERLRDQLLFWLAAALTPEAMPWYSGGLSRSLLGQVDEVRRAAVSATRAANGAPEVEQPVEVPRRAA